MRACSHGSCPSHSALCPDLQVQWVWQEAAQAVLQLSVLPNGSLGLCSPLLELASSQQALIASCMLSLATDASVQQHMLTLLSHLLSASCAAQGPMATWVPAAITASISSLRTCATASDEQLQHCLQQSIQQLSLSQQEPSLGQAAACLFLQQLLAAQMVPSVHLVSLLDGSLTSCATWGAWYEQVSACCLASLSLSEQWPTYHL